MKSFVLETDDNRSIEQAIEHLLSGSLSVFVLRGHRFDKMQLLSLLERIAVVRMQHPTEEQIVDIGGPREAIDSHTNLPWHHDRMYSEDPPLFTALYAVELEGEIGQTLFCDMQAAYAELPESLKQDLRARQSFHTSTQFMSNSHYPYQFKSHRHLALFKKTGRALHPLVMNDKFGDFLLFNESYCEIEVELREMLMQHCYQKKYIYRHEWNVHDLVIANNLKTNHKRIASSHSKRWLYRMHIGSLKASDKNQTQAQEIPTLTTVI